MFRIPAVCQETPVCMTRAITAWRWACWTFSFEGLPGERSAIKKTLPLPACCQRTAISTAVSGVLPTDMAKAVTARNRTPGKKQKTVCLVGLNSHWGWRRQEANTMGTKRINCPQGGVLFQTLWSRLGTENVGLQQLTCNVQIRFNFHRWCKTRSGRHH